MKGAWVGSMVPGSMLYIVALPKILISIKRILDL